MRLAGCGLQGEEDDASGCLSLPTSVRLLCLHSLPRPTLVLGTEAERFAKASSAARNHHVTCRGSMQELGENCKYPFKKWSVCQNESLWVVRSSTNYQTDPLLGVGSKAAAAQA